MKVRYYTQSDVAKECSRVSQDVISFLLHVFCWTLIDEFNFTPEQAKKVVDVASAKCHDHMGEDGEVSLHDVHEMLLQECGIDIYYDKERLK